MATTVYSQMGKETQIVIIRLPISLLSVQCIYTSHGSHKPGKVIENALSPSKLIRLGNVCK